MWNRWTTGHRMGTPSVCRICGQEGSKDHRDHYPFCEVNRNWMQKRLNEDAISLGNFHTWSLTHPRLQNNETLLLKLGIWMYVTHRCINSQRNDEDPMQAEEDIHRAMDQWGLEAIRSTPNLTDIWSNAWNPNYKGPKKRSDSDKKKLQRNSKSSKENVPDKDPETQRRNRAQRSDKEVQTNKGSRQKKRTVDKVVREEKEGQHSYAPNRKFRRPEDRREAFLHVRV